MATPENEENDGIHIDRIMRIVPCKKHGADFGQACWNILSLHGILRSICNDRAKAGGANGDVTPYKTHAETRAKKKEYSR